MKMCVHCGLPARSDCDHPQDVEKRAPRVTERPKATRNLSIHPRNHAKKKAPIT